MFKKVLIICLFFGVMLFGSVEISVDKSEVVRGDEVSFTISASGDSVKFPIVDNIDGFKVEQTGRSQSITIINGKTTKSISSSYLFTPLKSVTIPPLSVVVDGKKEMTKPVKIKVVSAVKAGANPNFLITMIANKKSVYVGEPITVKIIFKQKRDVEVAGIRFNSPSFPGFWVKSDNQDKKIVVGDYVIHNLTYVLIPQNPGNITIPPVKVEIAKRVSVRDAFSFMLQRVKWRNLYSNDLKIKIKPLPNGVALFGKFSIAVTVDKRTTEANKPVNLTLKIRGSGNIDDIDPFDLKIVGATVYKDKPKRDTYLDNGEYKGVFTQKFAIVADNSYTIPPIKLSYFDKELKKVVTIKTKPIKVEVKGGAAKITHKVETKESIPQTKTVKTVVVKEEHPYEKWIFLVIGLVFGFLSAKTGKLNFKKQKSEQSIIYEIKHAKNDKELLKILLPFSSKSSTIKEIIDKLEENIYLGKKSKMDKKVIIQEIDKILRPEDEEFI